MQLLTYPSLVESPFITVKIGNYTFGRYKNDSTKGEYQKTYPNYIKSLRVKKINGALNTYTIVMEYQISAGYDPNFLDKIFSASDRNIEISYGDYASPTMVYSKEKALITKVKNQIDFSSSKIIYTISCISTALKSKSVIRDYPAYNDKPSNIIKMMIDSSEYGLWDMFPGVKNISNSVFRSLIDTSDCTVKIEKKNQISVLDYLNYLVSCMTTEEDKNLSNKKTRFYLTICDDVSNDFNGTYFKVSKISLGENIKSVDSKRLYEVDIGFPTSDLITSFNITTDDTYSILYSASLENQNNDYAYRINDDGDIEEIYSPTISNNKSLFRNTESSRTWWSNMTNYPISASLTVKGLLRPLMLMSYVYINTYFYGRKHITSGLYVITSQEDSVDASGYKSTLTLTRIGGDNI